jgi:hypothetical protein
MRATERAAQGRRALRRFRRRACEARRGEARRGEPSNACPGGAARAHKRARSLCAAAAAARTVRPVAVCAAYRAPAPSPRRTPRRAPAKRRGAARAGFHAGRPRGRRRVGTADRAAGTRGRPARRRAGSSACSFVCLFALTRLLVCACLLAHVRWMGAAGVRTDQREPRSRAAHDGRLQQRVCAPEETNTHTQPSADARTSAGGRRAGTNKTASQSAIQHTQPI